MRPGIIFLFFLAFFSPLVFASSDSDYFVNFTSTSFSDGMSIKTLSNEFNGDYRDGKVAYSDSEIELGFSKQISKQNFLSFSATKRFARWYSFSSDTGKAFHQSNNNLPPEESKMYNIDLEAFGFTADGLKLHSSTYLTEYLSLDFSLTYIVVNDLTHFDGNGTLPSTDSQVTRLDYNYYYDEDIILGRPVDGKNGKGMSFDFSLFYKISNSWSASISLKDIYSFIKWDDAPISIMSVNNVPVTIDENNKFNIVPSLSGLEGFRDFKEQIPWASEVHLSYLNDQGKGFFINSLNNEYINDLALGVYLPFANNNFSIDYSIKAEALNLSLESSYLDFSIKLDSFNNDRISALDISFAIGTDL